MTKPSSRIDQRKAELRREIIDTAFDCFAEKGYHATGIADIATRLGIGHGTFYRYFANKRDIIDHVIDEVSGRIFGALDQNMEPESTATIEEYGDLIDRISDSLGRVVREDPRAAHLLLFHTTGIDDELTERVYGLIDATEILMTRYLEHGVRIGYLRADIDTVNTAKAALGMIVAGLIAGMRTPDPASMSVYSHAVRRLFIDGVRTAAR
ncbi:TetR/AcrR family transcriptional regulator [Nocardia alba]|uniref:TetR/AcrR family transcriptional regulator n=1 Tax=Nocardia alba TaxID=225051 RepID=UPI001FB1E4F7|nr:TetR/AcrR family transcriptional regulator [Nocardia alba]